MVALSDPPERTAEASHVDDWDYEVTGERIGRLASMLRDPQRYVERLVNEMEFLPDTEDCATGSGGPVACWAPLVLPGAARCGFASVRLRRDARVQGRTTVASDLIRR